MDLEKDQIKNKDELNSGKLNLFGFFYLINNSKETNRILQNLSENITQFFLQNNTHYNRINEISSSTTNPENIRKNYINTPIYKLVKIFDKIIQICFLSLDLFLSKGQIFISIENEISNLQKIIEELSIHQNDNSYSINENDDTNDMFKNLKNNMSELENKVIDEYIWEKYQKHISETNNKNIDQLVSDIEYLENTLFDYRKEKNEKYFEKIKSSDNKIQIVYNEIKKCYMEYCSYLKETYKKAINELENLEKFINSNIIDEEEINKETPIYSKSDFDVNEKDFNSNKYRIKIIKNRKIALKNSFLDNKSENKNKEDNFPLTKSFTFQEKENDNELKAKLFKDNFLFLNERDIYEIVSKLYSFNLKFFDKSNYDLDVEKGKLLALDLSNEIFLYNEEKAEIKNKFNKKYNEIIDSINKKILNNMKNIEKFYIALNNYRVRGKIKFTEKFYDLIIYIYKKTQDEILKDNKKDNDIKVSNLMLILSQTYYKEIDGKKIYILDTIKTHELFKNMGFWKLIITNKIKNEIQIIKNHYQKNGLSDKISQEKKEEIINTQIIPFLDLMKDCDIEKDKIIEISKQIFDKYKCCTSIREEVFSYVDQKK